MSALRIGAGLDLRVGRQVQVTIHADDSIRLAPATQRVGKMSYPGLPTRKAPRKARRNVKVAGPSCRTAECGARGYGPRGRTVQLKAPANSGRRIRRVRGWI